MRTLLSMLFLTCLAGCATGRPIEVHTSANAAQFTGAAKLTVTLVNFRFNPAPLRLKAGRPYALRLVNGGGGSHDFTAPDFFEKALVSPDDASLVRAGEIEMAGNSQVVVRLVPAAGTYDLVCTQTGHALLGMKTRIIVE